jgi:hypothetical protein
MKDWKVGDEFYCKDSHLAKRIITAIAPLGFDEDRNYFWYEETNCLGQIEKRFTDEPLELQGAIVYAQENEDFWAHIKRELLLEEDNQFDEAELREET